MIFLTIFLNSNGLNSSSCFNSRRIIVTVKQIIEIRFVIFFLRLLFKNLLENSCYDTLRIYFPFTFDVEIYEYMTHNEVFQILYLHLFVMIVREKLFNILWRICTFLKGKYSIWHKFSFLYTSLYYFEYVLNFCRWVFIYLVYFKLRKMWWVILKN